MRNTKQLSKGPSAEEALRSYFAELGYFAVRGVPFAYSGFDVTDIDLWLYGRTSSVSRDRTIVDIKNKKTPQAMERIFWVAGLKLATGADHAIVATTDKRPEVKEFGAQLSVSVLDGDFVKKIQNKYGHQSGRLSEEDFASLMARDFFEVRESSLRDQYIAAKSALSGTISFDSCNRWLEIGRRLAEACITRPQKQEVACRVLYKVLGYLCVGVDYLLKDLAFIEIKDRRVALLDGFSFGKGGRAGLDSILDAADGLLRQYVTNGEQIARTLRSSVTEDAMKIPANILSEYFSRPEIGKELFSTARAFDDYSVEVRFSPFGRLGTSAQSFLGVCLDYWQIERRRFLESFVP